MKTNYTEDKTMKTSGEDKQDNQMLECFVDKIIKTVLSDNTIKKTASEKKHLI